MICSKSHARSHIQGLQEEPPIPRLTRHEWNAYLRLVKQSTLLIYILSDSPRFGLEYSPMALAADWKTSEYPGDTPYRWPGLKTRLIKNRIMMVVTMSSSVSGHPAIEVKSAEEMTMPRKPWRCLGRLRASFSSSSLVSVPSQH